MLHLAEPEILSANKQKLLISTVIFLLSLAESEIFYACEYEKLLFIFILVIERIIDYD